MATEERIIYELGQLRGELSEMNRTNSVMFSKVENIEKRVDALHLDATQSGGIAGSVAGTAVAFGIALITEKLKGG